MIWPLLLSLAVADPSSAPAAAPAADVDDDLDELPHPRPRASFRPLPPKPQTEQEVRAEAEPPEDTTTGALWEPPKKPKPQPHPASQPASDAASQPASNESPIKEAPPDKMRKGELSMLGITEILNDSNFVGVGIGYFNLDSVHYISGTPQVDLNFFDKKLKMNFGASLNITLFDPNGGGFAVPSNRRIRVQDWDDWRDYFKIIRRVQWGKKEDRIFARIGRVGASSLGHGGLMRRYNNNMLANQIRVGLEVNLNSDYVGGEAFLSDITLGSKVLAGLLFVKPLGWMQNYAAKSLSLGFVYAADLGVPTALQRDEEGVVRTVGNLGNDPLYDEGKLHALGTSVEVKPVRIGDTVDIKTYFEFNQILQHGRGFTFGTLGRFNIGPIALRARAELRILGNDYIPSYFDNFYEIQKLQFVTFNPSTTAPTKLDFMRSITYPGGYAPNGYFEVTFSWIDKLALTAAYEVGGNQFLQSFLLHAEFTAFSWLRFFATYHKRNTNNFKNVFNFTQNDLLYAQIRLAVLPFLIINGRATKTFIWDPSVDLGLGGLRNVFDFSVSVDFGWQWEWSKD